MIPRVARGFRLMNTGEYESFLSFSFLVHYYFFDVSTFCVLNLMSCTRCLAAEIRKLSSLLVHHMHLTLLGYEKLIRESCSDIWMSLGNLILFFNFII